MKYDNPSTCIYNDHPCQEDSSITKEISSCAGIPHWKLFVDGASRGNPGLAGAGIYLLCDGKPIARKGFFVGIKTNNEAEYLALILGLLLLQDFHRVHEKVRIISDSQLLVRQILGEYKVKKKELSPLCEVSRILMHRFNATIGHVMRTDNEIADKMANYGIDKKVPLSKGHQEFLFQSGISI